MKRFMPPWRILWQAGVRQCRRIGGRSRAVARKTILHVEPLEAMLLPSPVALHAVAWYGAGQVGMRERGHWWWDDSLTDKGNHATATGPNNPSWLDRNFDGDASDPGEVHDPIAFVRSSSPAIKATFRVNPAVVHTIQVRATSTDGGTALVFRGFTRVSTKFVSLSLSTTDTVGAMLDNRDVQLSWTVSINGGTAEEVGSMTQRLFVVFGRPLETATNTPTAARIWYATYYGYGNTTRMGIAGDIARDAMSRFNPKRGALFGESAWRTYYAYHDCGSTSWLMHNALAVVGVPSQVRYVYPRSNWTAQWFASASRVHSQWYGSYRLIYVDYQGGYNNYEGTCFVWQGSDKRYYMGGERGDYARSPNAVLWAVAARLRWV